MAVAKPLRPITWVCSSCRSKARVVPLKAKVRWQSNTAAATGSQSRQWSTPLAKNIGEAIQTTGPISIAQYMRQCLTSPDGGYYTREAKDGDQFGQKGDFITSPEISQVFGELLGLWFVTEWMAQGRRRTGLELIEVGPGRGTLMDDMLRAVRNFKVFTGAIESVYMVEASPSLRRKQHQLLCGDAPMEATDIGWRSQSKYNAIPITWCEDIRFVPSKPDNSPFIVAHEFFDALPIHAFRSVPPAATAKQPSTITGLDGKPIELRAERPSAASKTHQWRELVVGLAPPPPPPSSKAHTATPPHKPYANVSIDGPPPDFQLSQAKASNPSSLVIPETSDRYRAVKSTTDAVIEVSPDSHSYAGEIARRIGGGNLSSSSSSSSGVDGGRVSARAATMPSSAVPKASPSGAALILDYGTSDTVPTSTLRGIRAHELVSPFSLPGLTDLSADVDFTALAEAAVNASPGIEVHGPVEQGAFLEAMGIRERTKVLEKKATGEDGDKAKEAAKRIRSAVERLVERGGGGMGRIYKAMAIVPENGGRRRPVGFGGQVVQ